MLIRVQAEDFDLGAVLDEMRAGRHDIGALVSFTGLVRDTKGDLEQMTLEHYPGMTQKALTEIAEQASTRWQLNDAAIIHRFGALKPGDQIMMVAAASAHRAAAFEAADFMMDYLKSRAPFWKQEKTADNTAWVDAKEADDTARDRWEK